jgi:hypothetical protein
MRMVEQGRSSQEGFAGFAAEDACAVRGVGKLVILATAGAPVGVVQEPARMKGRIKGIQSDHRPAIVMW